MNTTTIAANATAKSSLLRGASTAAPKRRTASNTNAPSTLRLIAYMAIAGTGASLIWYVAAVIGISRVQPEPVHHNVAAAHHFTRETV